MYRPVDQITTVGVMGFGRAGSAIAECLAEHGLDVVVTEPSRPAVDLGWQTIDRTQAMLIDAGMLDEAAAGQAKRRITIAGSPAAFADADFLIESVTEDLDLKRRLISEVESIVAPDIVIASNTSGYPITRIQEAARDPRRICGMHWTLAASMSRFLEVTRGDQTSPEAAEVCVRLGQRCGKEPAILNKDKAGFLANRLLYAMYREAFSLLAQGVADAESIDRVVRNDTGITLAARGIFRLMDIAGLEAVRSVCSHLFADLAADKTPPQLLDDLVKAGRTGLRAGKGVYDYTPAQAQANLDEFAAFAIAANQAVNRLRPLPGL